MLLLVALAGPSQPAAAASQASTSKQSKDPTQPRTPADTQIERTIKNKLAKSKMSGEHFTVSVVKGVATLEGTTNVMQHKGAMTRMARSSGATLVQNNIRISDAAKNKAVASLAKGRSAPSSSPPSVKSSSSTGSGLISRPVARGSSGEGNATSPVPRVTVLPVSN